MSHSQFFLLKTRRFLPLFITQFLGAFNDNVFKNALIILITYRAAEKISVDPRLLVTAAAGIFILPFFLFSATAGQLADKFEKSRLVQIIKTVEIFLMVLAAIGFYFESYGMLLFILFCVGVHSTFFGPIKYSILPEHLAEKELIGGNALVEAGTFLAILLGTILGGVLILKECGVMAVSTIIIGVAAAGLISSRFIPKTIPVAPNIGFGLNFIAETWRLVRHTAGEKDVFLAILGISWFWLVGFTFLAQFPVYVSDVLRADENVVTLFLTVFSVGIALGSLICNRLLKGEISGVYVPMGAIGMTAGIFLFWGASPGALSHAEMMNIAEFLTVPQHGVILASLLVIAIFGGVYIVPLYAIMQSWSEASHRSRTVAVNNILNAFFMVAGAVITMALLNLKMSVTDIFLILGFMNVPVAILIRRVVRMRRAEKGKKV